ncbi:MAG TPA: protein translocase subunit SecD [Thermodesulfobacteriota bacterium]|nr:protein translocase subunit SecD [Thermodesulfobacteriota bacterium]
MVRNLFWRFIIVLLSTLAGIFYLVPSITDNIPSWWHEKIDKIHLGLDLQGGMHLITEVQTDKAIENTLNQYVQTLEEVLDEEKIPFIEITLRKDQTIAVELLDKSTDEKFEEVMKKNFPALTSLQPETGESFYRPIFALDKNEIRTVKDSTVKQALETIRNRIDQFGVTEPNIQRQGEDRILIQLPGLNDPERAKRLLKQTAMLEFKLVNDEDSLQNALEGRVPPENEILYEETVDKKTGIVTDHKPLLLKKRTLLTGDMLVDAQPQIDSAQFNQPYVSIKFNAKGGKIFKTVTTNNVGKRLAIVLDNVIKSAPVIREPITGGRAQIEGNFTLEEAKDLAIVLRAGSLPAPIKILEERTVGPSLGKDSIDQGIRATVIGSLLVLLFMFIYYKLSGLIADIALVLNMVLIFAVLAAFEAALTLPGIAGIVLTLGMAVDANVLIFERIREELRAGKTTWAAVDAGYAKAFSAIFDSNLTTVLAAAILFQFGTGPVKGFAVTLCVGIMASFFTALFVTRVVFDYFVLVKKVKSVSI